MKRTVKPLLTLVLLIALSFSLSGCFLNNTVLAIDKTLPRTPTLELAPYWVFDTAFSLDPDNQDIDGDYFKGLGAYLSSELIQIGTDVVESPEMKVMRIRTYDYFLTRYRIAPQQVGLAENEMVLYTITDAKGFSARIYRVNDSRIALERNNILLYFNRTGQLKDTGITMNTDAKGKPVKSQPSNANGVLLGLRGQRPVDENGVLGPAPYRTLWIAQKRGGGLEIYEVPEIIFPRNVFYQLKVERQENIEVVRETIVLKNLSTQSETRESAPPPGLSRFSDLTFVSNDYLSVASRLHPDKQKGAMQRYSTRHVNKLDYESRIRITDLFGPEGISVMKTAAAAALASAKHGETSGLGELKDDSFILTRYNGRWIYEGRINSQEPYGDKSLTFPMNFRDNFRVYRYDTLIPNWPKIRSVVPDALGAVSSPDDFFTVIRTKNELLVYAKDDQGGLAQEPLAILPTAGEEVIMHEWALGSYVDDWSAFVRPLGRPLK